MCWRSSSSSVVCEPTAEKHAPASDSQSTLLAQINRIYGISARLEPAGDYQPNFGFIID